MNLSQSEFDALRRTIAGRGTARMILFPVTAIGWAIVAGTLMVTGGGPASSLFSLIVLAAGFEAIHALHVGAERIGRYIQVFYEGPADGPRWETTAMAVGPALPGGGVDPLFTVLFALTTLANLIPALGQAPTRIELAVIVLAHVAMLIRLVRARGAAARQRAVELESYRAIRARETGSSD